MLTHSIHSIAAGQNTTIFLSRPSEKFSDLPRHPEEITAPERCIICNKDYGDDDSPLECDKCDSPCHLKCLNPPLDKVPEGEWFCADCEANPGAPVGKWAEKKKGKGVKAKATNTKRAADDQYADDADTGTPSLLTFLGFAIIMSP